MARFCYIAINPMGTIRKGMHFKISVPKQFWRPVIGLLLLPLIVGCIGIARNRYSQPIIEGFTTPVNKWFEGDIGRLFVFDDIHFAIETGNNRGTSIMLFPLPIPFPIRDPPFQNPSFTISVQLKPQKSGATFDLQKILFWEDTSEKRRPILIEGPYDCAYSRPAKRALPIVPFVLREDIYTCMLLFFDVIPPDPSRTFFIKIDGLTFDGVARPLPLVRFKENARIETIAVP